MKLTRYNLLKLISDMSPNDYQTFDDMIQNFENADKSELSSYLLELKNSNYIKSTIKTSDDTYLLHHYDITNNGREYMEDKKSIRDSTFFGKVAAITGILSAIIGLLSIWLQRN